MSEEKRRLKERLAAIMSHKKSRVIAISSVVLLGVIVFSAVYLGAVSNNDKPTSQEVAAARSVVEEYFRACEVKDSQAILKTLTPESVSPNTQLFGKETKTLLAIDYDPEDPMRQEYITFGRGSLYDIREENVIVFRVSFNIKYPEGVTGAWNEGKYEDWSIVLIRDDKDSPWLIDGQGW
jgi:hypothetical protein